MDQCYSEENGENPHYNEVSGANPHYTEEMV